MIDLELLVRQAGEHAQKVLIGGGQKSLSPFYHLIAAPPKQDAVVLAHWADEREKIAIIEATKEIARNIDAAALLFVGEAWVVTRHAPTQWHRDRVFNEAPPSQQPDRREIVFAGATDGEHNAQRMWQIVRAAPGGAIISLVELKEMHHADFSGRLVIGILPHDRRRP